MVRLGLVALDGTKIEANAAAAANRTHAALEQQVAELLAQAAEADAAEDGEPGVGGEELPRALARRAERLARLQLAGCRSRCSGVSAVHHMRSCRAVYRLAE